MTPEEQERLVADLETALDRLQALYNQFFMGIEKLEPTIQRKEVERRFQALRKEKLANTALRFRLQTQIQKYNTQSNYWRRISKQIEEGTYQRDLMRARKRSEQQGGVDMARRALASLDDPVERPTPVANLRDSGGFDLDDPFGGGVSAGGAPGGRAREAAAAADNDPDKTPVPVVGTGVHRLHERLIADARAANEEDGDVLAEFFQRRSVPPPPPTASATTRPPPARKAAASAGTARGASPRGEPRSAPKSAPKKAQPKAPGLGEDRMRAIYRAYLAARKKTGESTENVTFEKVSGLLGRQLSAKEGIRDFKVVIRAGKAVIKTVKDE